MIHDEEGKRSREEKLHMFLRQRQRITIALYLDTSLADPMFLTYKSVDANDWFKK